VANSAVGSPLVKYKQTMLAARDYRPAATTRLIEKDLDLILASGRELGVPLPMAALARQMYAAASATGKGDLDFFSLVLQAEEMAGLGEAAGH
jgi:3-hydroxyisobutyrate dehydrogenase-like beta-hydroxyacid dehydrogenase